MNMDIYEFSTLYLQPYKTRGDEILPELCPFCHGGPKGEKYKFALNTERKVFNCMRKNECGRTGTFRELCNHFGVTSMNDSTNRYEGKTFVPPKTQTGPVQSKSESYLTSRGFSRGTWERRKVAEHYGKNGKPVIAMPYYENGQIVLMKYRTTDNPSQHWREPKGKPIFWGMELCDPEFPLVVVEGEMDALALDESGVRNAVSVPSGASDLSCIEHCWEWLEKFRSIILWVDNDKAGKDLFSKLIIKLGQFRCYAVESPYKDANECLLAEGAESVKKAVELAKEVPFAGIDRLADAEIIDFSRIERVCSGFKKLDATLGGFRMGELSVWTGINSSGKSVLLSQILVEAIDQGVSVFAYSGELTIPLFKSWVHLQMAGPNNLISEFDHTEREYIGVVSGEVAGRLEQWYRDRFYVYNAYTAKEPQQLLSLCEIAARRYNCKVFLIDNLMTTNLEGSKGDNFYLAQSMFVGRFVDFAKRHMVHVHLVAHPRKTEGRLNKMDIAGSGNITDRADNVIALHRFSRDEKLSGKYMNNYFGYDALIQIFKNRFRGKQDVEFGVKYDIDSKRFCQADEPDALMKKYSWETGAVDLCDALVGV
ncbi:MAG: toprim domain-containing protein [Candidatus Brocadiaceae bacterium]|nr:toprim domain-containing protein [Candidatus Brocadiaceae bacterium]